MLTKDYRQETVDTPELENRVPDAVQIREHLDVVLASDEFSASRRASELLQHVVERALAGDMGSLKERLLGVEIFHRRSDYNTSTDAIVRVTANDVRRRLSQFYSRHPDQPLRISLPLGSYVPDFIPTIAHVPDPAQAGGVHVSSSSLPHSELPQGHSSSPAPSVDPSAPAATPIRASGRVLPKLQYALGLVLAVLVGWWFHSMVHTRDVQTNSAYSFYNDLLGPIGLNGPGKTEIALTNPHMLLYLGLNSPGPALGASPKDIPVPSNMAAVLNKSANDNQADFPYHHFFVDYTNYTGIGEAKAAFGLARTLEATGRTAELTEERFLNWETARQEPLVILGAPHESKFVQDTLSAANFTIGYDSIHNAHPLPGEQTDYSKSRAGDVLEDYGLIWMTQSPSGTRILVLAGLSSAGTAGVGEFFSDPDRMKPVYQQLRAAAGSNNFPDSWQVLLRIQARQDVPVSVTPVAVRITRKP
ncbi:MAG TPA: hypothetical protein VGU25_11775 [Acidobacteriaceae bacterium]|nr:hypothetical protein [Acidobacteriaceae bacterium]